MRFLSSLLMRMPKIFWVGLVLLVVVGGVLFYATLSSVPTTSEQITFTGELQPDGEITLTGTSNIKGDFEVAGELQPDGSVVINLVGHEGRLEGQIALEGDTELRSFDYIGLTEPVGLTGTIDSDGMIRLAGRVSEPLTRDVSLTGEVDSELLSRQTAADRDIPVPEKLPRSAQPQQRLRELVLRS